MSSQKLSAMISLPFILYHTPFYSSFCQSKKRNELYCTTFKDRIKKGWTLKNKKQREWLANKKTWIIIFIVGKLVYRNRTAGDRRVFLLSKKSVPLIEQYFTRWGTWVYPSWQSPWENRLRLLRPPEACILPGYHGLGLAYPRGSSGNANIRLRRTWQ